MLRSNANTNTKNNGQNNNINYFLLDQCHIKDIMTDIWYSIVKMTFTWGWQKTHKTKRKYKKVLEKLK